MERVEFKFKRNGHSRMMSQAQAALLHRVGLGTYENRSMADKPRVQKEPAAPMNDPADGLDGLEKEEPHALAKERGVQVHHLAGADKVRAALRAAASE